MNVPAELDGIKSILKEFVSEERVIYFLINSGVVVYVGTTRSLGARVMQHRGTRPLAERLAYGEKNFDQILYVTIDNEQQALDAERSLISRLQPAHNRKLFKGLANEQGVSDVENILRSVVSW